MVQVAQIQPFPEPASVHHADEETAHARDLIELPLAYLVPVERVGALTSALPARIRLGSLRDGRLRVTSPIEVQFEREERHVIAEATELSEFGFGANASEALGDLQRAITELYFALEQEQDRLGADLGQVWARLTDKVTRAR